MDVVILAKTFGIPKLKGFVVKGTDRGLVPDPPKENFGTKSMKSKGFVPTGWEGSVV